VSRQRRDILVNRSRTWLQYLAAPLVPADRLEQADAIFVLGGHRIRKIFAARLFRDHWAPRLLMSTGVPSYIARVIESELPPAAFQRLESWREIHETGRQPDVFWGQRFVYVDAHQWAVIPIKSHVLGTLSELEALADWLVSHPEVRSLLIVSLAAHLRRVRLCCRRLFPRDCQVRLIPATMSARDLAELGEAAERDGVERITLEWSKLILYALVLPFRRRRARGAEG